MGATMHRGLGLVLVMLAVVGPGARALRAQRVSVPGSAAVSIPAAVSLQQATAPAVVSRSEHLVVMSADLVVAANAAFDVVLRPTSGIDALARKGITMSVLASSGAYVPVDGSSPVSITRNERGAGRLTHVVYRFASSTVIADADISVGVEYAAVAGGTTAVLRVLASQQVTPAVQVALAGQ